MARGPTDRTTEGMERSGHPDVLRAGLARLPRQGGLDVRLASPQDCRWRLEDLAGFSAVLIEIRMTSPGEASLRMMQEPTLQTTPILVSDNGRYFVRPDGAPFFWLADTQWQLFRSFTLQDAAQILANRSRLGFTCLQIMLVGVDPLENVEGQRPWLHDDPRRPNEKYFEHVDKVIALCLRHPDLVLVVGVYHTVRMKGLVHADNARSWARWVGQRYAAVPSIVWSMYPKALPEDVPVCRELAIGLQEADGGSHLITAHPDPSPASSSTILHDQPWLAFNSIQVFKRMDLIHPMVTSDSSRYPLKPVVMAEGAYEAGIEYGFDVTPLWVRRQAYYSYLAGGSHSYGHNHSWRVPPSWKEALDAPGAAQMGICKNVFLARSQWWQLTPDPSLLVAGGQTDGDILTLAARHAEGRWAIVYAASPTRFSVAMHKLGPGPESLASWVDPRTGQCSEKARYSNSGVQTFTTPHGWEDSLLVLDAP